MRTEGYKTDERPRVMRSGEAQSGQRACPHVCRHSLREWRVRSANCWAGQMRDSPEGQIARFARLGRDRVRPFLDLSKLLNPKGGSRINRTSPPVEQTS